MISHKMIFLSFIFVLGTKQILIESLQTDKDRSHNIKKSVAKLNTMYTKFINDDLKPEQNAIFSPLNIYTALSLLHLGATGKTREELSSALGIPANDTGLTAHQDLGKLLNDLQKTDSAEVRIANKIFVREGEKVKHSYLKASKKCYKNKAQLVPFGSPKATNIVNKWVSKNTKNHIRKLYEGVIPLDTVLLAASALFFNASWEYSFAKTETKIKKFNTGVKDVTVEMMHSSERVRVPYMDFKKLGIEAISIPYSNSEFSMAVILPHRNKSIKTIVDRLNPEHQQQIIRQFRSTRIERCGEYEIPRFKFGWNTDIKELVKKSGVKEMFGSAEFDNLLEKPRIRLYVSQIVHATEIQVDEYGTEAAAVTAIEMMDRAMHEPNFIKFKADRPFLFWIYHAKTDVILFTGIVQNPSIDS